MNEDDFSFQMAFKNWIQCIESHVNCMARETNTFTEILKDTKLSEKTKNEIASTIGDSLASIENISETMKRFVE